MSAVALEEKARSTSTKTLLQAGQIVQAIGTGGLIG
jgi:hypothetical protein